MRQAPKDGHTRHENLRSQPLIEHPVFNNPDVLTEGWYPVCPSSQIATQRADSFRVGYQRVLVYRGADGAVRALDAFCPHMGADLANGRVVGNEIECYFHRFRFDGAGQCTSVCSPEQPPRGARLASYPAEEHFGFIWVYAGARALHAFPTCPGLEGKDTAHYYLGAHTLYAHHHVMMAGGIDLMHFSTVHELDINFSFDVVESEPGVADWNLSGFLPSNGVRGRLGRFLLGARFGYALRFAGGSIAAITYGKDERLFGSGPKLPSLHVLWGAEPLENGVSKVHVFLLTHREPGVSGQLEAGARLAATAALLAALKDDDIEAFPHMRFNAKNLMKGDRSVARFIQYVNRLNVSPWSKTGEPLVAMPRRLNAAREEPRPAVRDAEVRNTASLRAQPAPLTQA